jgi:hypothetical protein
VWTRVVSWVGADVAAVAEVAQAALLWPPDGFA